MKLQIITLIILLISAKCLFAQEITDLQITQLSIENTEGELQIIGGKANFINLPKNITTEIVGSNIILKNQSSQKIFIEIPKHCSIKINNHKGNINIKDFEGKIEVDAQEGNISLENLNNEVYINTNKGNIKGLFKDIFPKKIISFVNVEGNVDLFLPQNIEVNWQIKADKTIKNAFWKDQKNTDFQQNSSPVNPEKPTYLIYNKGGMVSIKN